MRRVFVDPAAPQHDALQEAATWIRDGGVVALAAHGRYVLVTDPRQAAAAARGRAILGMNADVALPLMEAPPEATARAVCAGAGRPVAAAGAHREGSPAIVDPDEIERSMGDSVDVLLDTGRS